MKRCMQIAAELTQKNTAFASLFFQCKMSLVKCALSVFVLRAMCIVHLHIIFSVHMWNMRAMNRSILKMQLNELKRKMHLYIMLCDAKLRWCMVKRNKTKPQRSHISKFPKPKIYIKVIYVRIVAPLPRFRAMQHFCSSVAGSFGSYSCFRFGFIFHILRCGSCRLMVLFSSLRAIARACNAMRGNCDDFIFNEENKTLALFCLFVWGRIYADRFVFHSLVLSFCWQCGFVMVEIFGFVRSTHVRHLMHLFSHFGAFSLYSCARCLDGLGEGMMYVCAFRTVIISKYNATSTLN